MRSFLLAALVLPLSSCCCCGGCFGDPPLRLETRPENESTLAPGDDSTVAVFGAQRNTMRLSDFYDIRSTRASGGITKYPAEIVSVTSRPEGIVEAAHSVESKAVKPWETRRDAEVRLHALAPGTTTLTIRATVNGEERTARHQIKVVGAATNALHALCVSDRRKLVFPGSKGPGGIALPTFDALVVAADPAPAVRAKVLASSADGAVLPTAVVAKVSPPEVAYGSAALNPGPVTIESAKGERLETEIIAFEEVDEWRWTVMASPPPPAGVDIFWAPAESVKATSGARSGSGGSAYIVPMPYSRGRAVCRRYGGLPDDRDVTAVSKTPETCAHESKVNPALDEVELRITGTGPCRVELESGGETELIEFHVAL